MHGMHVQNAARRAASAIGAAILALSLMPAAALAAVTDDIYVIPGDAGSPTAANVDDLRVTDQAYISKVVWSASTAKFNRTFSFQFQPISCNGFAAGTVDADMPAIPDQSITVTNENKVSTSANGESSEYTNLLSLSFLKTGTTTANNTFSHAGEYTYLVTQKSETVNDWIDSKAEYTLRIYVANEENALAIKGVTVNKNIEDRGGVADSNNYVYDSNKHGSGTDSKVDPSDPNDPEDGNGWKDLAGWEYLSVYEPKSNLSISMLTSGAYANHDLVFDYTLTLHRAAYVAAHDTTASYTGIIVDDKGAPVSHLRLKYGISESFQMKHGWKIVFDGTTAFNDRTSTKLPAGTMYDFTQTGETGYSNSTVTKSSGLSETTTSTGTKLGSDLSLVYAPVSSVVDPQAVKAATAVIGQDPGNSSVITNSIEIIPTLAVAKSLPFVLVVGGIAIALATSAFLVARRRAHETR